MLQKNIMIAIFILNFALIISFPQLIVAQKVDKATLLTGINNLNSSIFSHSPLLEYPIQDKGVLSELLADTAPYIKNNSSNDKVISSAMITVAKESENILKTSEYLYVARNAAVRNSSIERALFASYTKSISNLTSAKKQLQGATYVAPGKRSSREILIGLIDILIPTAQKAYQVYEAEEQEMDERSKDKNYVITFLSASQGKVFELARVFKTPRDTYEKNIRMQAFNQWAEAIRLVDKYVAFNSKSISSDVKNYLSELKQLADALINTTKFINTSVFPKEGIVSGSANDKNLVNAYASIAKRAKSIGLEIKLNISGNVRDVLSAFALIIEATAEKLPTAFNNELKRRNS